MKLSQKLQDFRQISFPITPPRLESRSHTMDTKLTATPVAKITAPPDSQFLEEVCIQSASGFRKKRTISIKAAIPKVVSTKRIITGAPANGISSRTKRKKQIQSTSAQGRELKQEPSPRPDLGHRAGKRTVRRSAKGGKQTWRVTVSVRVRVPYC